jgi:hypothetical protein
MPQTTSGFTTASEAMTTSYRAHGCHIPMISALLTVACPMSCIGLKWREPKQSCDQSRGKENRRAIVVDIWAAISSPFTRLKGESAFGAVFDRNLDAPSLHRWAHGQSRTRFRPQLQSDQQSHPNWTNHHPSFMFEVRIWHCLKANWINSDLVYTIMLGSLTPSWQAPEFGGRWETRKARMTVRYCTVSNLKKS